MRRTKEEAEQTKQDIISAALDVFEEKSYSTATLSNIAKKAGVTRGAIYWHFENKFDILKELMDKYFGQFLNDVYREVEESKGSSLEIIKIVLNSYVVKVLNNPETLKFRKVIELKISLTDDTKEINELFGEFKKVISCKLRDLIEKGQKNGEIRNDMPTEFLMISIISWIFGYESITLSPTKYLDVEFDNKIIVENLVKFIKA